MAMQFELTKEFLEELEGFIEQQANEEIRAQLEGLYPADINTILYELDTNQSKYVIDLLDPEVRAEIISHLDVEVRERFVKSFSPAEIADIVSHVETDDAADILNEQPVRIREEVISCIDDEERVSNLLELLRYEEDSAGGLMAKELIKVNQNWHVGQCIEEIRQQAERVDKILSVYVVDDAERLVGRISVKKLLLASDRMKVMDLLDADVVQVDSFTSKDEVARLMSKYDLESIPVVNIQRKLLGRITIDDIVDVIQEQADENRQMMAGITKDVEHDDSLTNLVKARLPWLVIGMGGGLLAASLISRFEGDLQVIPILAAFIPLITATGGNVGIQSSSIIVQVLANKSSMGTNLFEHLFKSFTVAVMNGLVIAAIVFTATFAYSRDPNLSIVVATALFSVVVLASLMGTITPFVLDKFGINPALAAGPFITTTNDLLGILVYFSVAELLILH